MLKSAMFQPITIAKRRQQAEAIRAVCPELQPEEQKAVRLFLNSLRQGTSDEQLVKKAQQLSARSIIVIEKLFSFAFEQKDS